MPGVALLPNPLIPGFNPDPSIVRVGEDYFVVTSSFEYLPGLPVYKSRDLVHWQQIGNVAPRLEQIRVEDMPTGAGVYAPTIRHHNGVFYVIVTVMSPVGCVVFSAKDPAGPWSEGLKLPGVEGIDPDLAWDDDGKALVTYSAAIFVGPDAGRHHGIRQVVVDLVTGKTLEGPKQLWSGTGLKYPEAPHVYRRGNWWYLVIAEGGTERGHSISVARGKSPSGPFEGHPDNPLMTASGSSSPIQNTGHADLFDTVDGETAMVLLGMRPLGAAGSFSPLGRETFVAPVEWVDGWPIPRMPKLELRKEAEGVVFDFSDVTVLDDPGWIAVRNEPKTVGKVANGRLIIEGQGAGPETTRPRFLGRRQRHMAVTLSTTLDVSEGGGGLAVRYDEHQWFALEASRKGSSTIVKAIAQLQGVSQSWEARFTSAEVRLEIETRLPPAGFTAAALGADRIRLKASADGQSVELAELDGRYWTAESCTSFTGRVFGLYARGGLVAFSTLHYQGSDTPTATSASA